jgi:hypothetical protein
MPFTTSAHRAPYHSPYGANHYHNGYRYPHHHVFFTSSFWPFWGWPYWGLGYPYSWGYPYWPIFPDYPDNDDSQQPSQQQPPYVAPPSDDDDGPYQPESAPVGAYPQQPNSFYRAPYGGEQSRSPASGPVTFVFKDGRPPEKIANYLLTSKTLTVFDQPRHDIPVDQIDLDATAKVNRQAGVAFSVPVRN